MYPPGCNLAAGTKHQFCRQWVEWVTLALTANLQQCIAILLKPRNSAKPALHQECSTARWWWVINVQKVAAAPSVAAGIGECAAPTVAAPAVVR